MEEEKKEEVKEPTEREKIYEQYTKTEAKEEKTEVPPVEEPAKEKEAEPAPVEAAKKTPEPEVKEKKEEKKEKFVPYDALHEERIKRKAEAQARQAAEDRAKALQEELAKLKQEPEPIADYDREIHSIKQKLTAFEILENRRIEQEKKDLQAKMQADLTSRIDNTHKELTEEGYPGFKMMIGAVTQRIVTMIQNGQEEEARALDNPTGWKKIFKEEVFSEFDGEYKEALRKREVNSKIELKKQANLVNHSGKPAPKEKDPENITQDEMRANYLKLRRGA